MHLSLSRSVLIEQAANPNSTDSQVIDTASIPSNRFMKTVGYIFGYILSIMLLLCANLLINDFSSSVFERSDAALVSFTALIPLVIELPKRTKKNIFISISSIVLCVFALFTYCGTFICENNIGQENVFSRYPLFFNIPLIVLGLLIGILYCINKEND